MKNIFILFIFILPSSLFSNSDFPFEVHKRLWTNFNGTVGNEQIAMCYGDYGIISYTTDKGETWGQFLLGDSNDVRKMIYYKDAFYGVSDYFLFKSTDNGKSWQYKSLNSTSFDFVLKGFDIHEDKIYVPIKEGIRVFNLNFEEQTVDFIKVAEEPIIGHISIADGIIFTSKNKTTVYSYNLKNNTSKEHNLLLFDQCDICDGIQRIKTFDNNNYISFNNQVLKFSSNIVSYELLANNVDPNFIILDNKIYYARTGTIPKAVLNTVLDIQNYEVIEVSETIQNPVAKTNDLVNVTPRMVINEINEVGNKWYSVGNFHSILSSDKLIDNWNFKSLKTLMAGFDIFQYDDDTFFYYRSRSSRMTTNSGATWLPIVEVPKEGENSFFANSYWINQKGYGIGNLGPFVNFGENQYLYVTKDYGKSFDRIDAGNMMQGTGGWDAYLAKDDGFVLFGNTNLGGIVYSMTKVFDKDFNFVSQFVFDSLSIHEIKEDKNGDYFALVSHWKEIVRNQGPPHYLNNTFEIMKSTDKGETWETYWKTGVFIGRNHSSNHNPPLKTFNDFSFGIRCSFPEPYQPMNYFFDFENKIIDSVVINYSFLTSQYEQVKVENRIYNSKFEKVDDKFTSYISWSENEHITWKQEHTINMNELVPRWLEGKDDELGIYHDTQLQRIGLLNNSFYATINTFNRMAYFVNPFTKDSTFEKSGYDNTLLFRPKTPSSVENAELETPRSRAFLHAGKPYPLPAVSTVSTDLHWNAQYSAQEALLKVFDSMGNEIPNAQVELQQTNPYSGTVTWDCGTYPTGVYFIQVTIGTEQTNVGVAVVR